MLKMFFWFLMPLTLFMADADPPVGDPPTEPPAEPPVTEPPVVEKKIELTQEQLDGMFAPRMKKAGDKAILDLVKELGFETVDEAKAQLAKAEEGRKARMTELEKAQEELRLSQEAMATAEGQAAERERLANESLMRAALITEASKPEYKLNPDVHKDIWLHANVEMKAKLSVDENGNVTGAEEVLKAIIKDRSYWLVDDTLAGTTTRQKRLAMQQAALQQQAREEPEKWKPIIRV